MIGLLDTEKTTEKVESRPDWVKGLITSLVHIGTVALWGVITDALDLLRVNLQNGNIHVNFLPTAIVAAVVSFAVKFAREKVAPSAKVVHK